MSTSPMSYQSITEAVRFKCLLVSFPPFGSASIRPGDVASPTDFRRNIKSSIQRRKLDGKHGLPTGNGNSKVVIQSAASYQPLVDALESLKHSSE